MQSKEASLVEKMRTAAPGNPRSGELLEKAYDLEQAIQKFGSEDSPRKLLGAWARARILWCDISGEPLI